MQTNLACSHTRSCLYKHRSEGALLLATQAQNSVSANNDRELTDVFYLTVVQLANNYLCLTHLLLMDGSLLTVPFRETVAQCMQG